MSAQAQGQQQQHFNKITFTRCLLPTSDCGIIIGKEGKNVKEIREKTQVRIKLSEFIKGSEERCLEISGDEENVVEAYEMVTNLLKEKKLCFGFLVPHSCMGSIIGKEGRNIKDLQTHARVIAKDELLVGSTDRIVLLIQNFKVENSLDEFKVCLGKLIRILTSITRPKDHVGYKPERGRSVFIHSHSNTNSSKPHFNKHESGDLKNDTIHIPADMVGAIIGKEGRYIAEIRRVSGASVRIGDDTGTKERIVTVTGSIENNQKALYMLYQKLEQERKRLESQGQQE